MEDFKKIVKRRITIMPIMILIIILATAFGLFYQMQGSGRKGTTFIPGFHLGFTVGILGVAILYVIKYAIALKDEEKLRNLYIEEHDERTIYIESQTGGVGMNLIIAGLGIGTVIAGYFSEVVFFTLFGAMSFASIVKTVLRLFYNLKY